MRPERNYLPLRPVFSPKRVPTDGMRGVAAIRRRWINRRHCHDSIPFVSRVELPLRTTPGFRLAGTCLCDEEAGREER